MMKRKKNTERRTTIAQALCTEYHGLSNMNPTEIGVEFLCCRSVSNSCSTGGTRQKRQNNCEKLNTRFHANFRPPFWENPYYTPHVIQHTLLHPHVIQHTLLHPRVIRIRLLHPWEIWLGAFRSYHICKIKHILSKYMIICVHVETTSTNKLW